MDHWDSFSVGLQRFSMLSPNLTSAYYLCCKCSYSRSILFFFFFFGFPFYIQTKVCLCFPFPQVTFLVYILELIYIEYKYSELIEPYGIDCANWNKPSMTTASCMPVICVIINLLRRSSAPSFAATLKVSAAMTGVLYPPFLYVVLVAFPPFFAFWNYQKNSLLVVF